MNAIQKEFKCHKGKETATITTKRYGVNDKKKIKKRIQNRDMRCFADDKFLYGKH